MRLGPGVRFAIRFIKIGGRIFRELVEARVAAKVVSLAVVNDGVLRGHGIDRHAANGVDRQIRLALDDRQRKLLRGIHFAASD